MHPIDAANAFAGIGSYPNISTRVRSQRIYEHRTRIRLELDQPIVVDSEQAAAVGADEHPSAGADDPCHLQRFFIRPIKEVRELLGKRLSLLTCRHFEYRTCIRSEQ